MSDSRPLDRLDMRILVTLHAQGGISNKELAEHINLSPSACHQRLHKLIDDGWIAGFTGNLNIERLCSPVQCIATFSLNNQSPETFEFVEKRIESLPEALECFTVSGPSDLVVRFACGNMNSYMSLTNGLMRDCPEINHINTHVIMKHNKSFSGFPLKSLVQDSGI